MIEQDSFPNDWTTHVDDDLDGVVNNEDLRIEEFESDDELTGDYSIDDQESGAGLEGDLF